MEKIESVKYQKAVEKIRACLARWLESGVDLFLTLRDVERAGDWKAPGHAQFVDFLKAEFPTALGIERYQNVVKAIDLYGIDFVRRIGVHSCHALGVEAVARDPARIALVKASIEHHIFEHGAAPDDNKVRDIVRGIAPEIGRPHRDTRTITEIARLQGLLRTANVRIRELEKQLAEARERPAPGGSTERVKKGGARKASPKHAD